MSKRNCLELKCEYEDNIRFVKGRFTDSFWRDLRLTAFGAFVCLFIVAFIGIVPIWGHSMLPTIAANRSQADGPAITVIVFRTRSVTYNDIVVLNREDEGQRNLIKRVVALEGDKVAVVSYGGRYMLRVNGRVVDEPYIYSDLTAPMNEITIPEGSIFVMGDNRQASVDSRYIGSISESHIIGKVIVISDNDGFRFYAPQNRVYLS